LEKYDSAAAQVLKFKINNYFIIFQLAISFWIYNYCLILIIIIIIIIIIIYIIINIQIINDALTPGLALTDSIDNDD